MPKKRLVTEKMSSAERDFTMAFERLEKGTPKHPKLKVLAAKGRLRVNPSSVALEAGRSRTLIGTDDCPYPAIRQRILELKRPIAQSRTQDEIISKLRADNKALKAENERIATQLADAVAAAFRLKKELDFQREVKRKQPGRSTVVPLIRNGEGGTS